ncbi:malectin domain-containing carbohydrate-binding protein [Longitalea luteola]|uniref:malectin domain-containing carbohydrate-binding protein n=1 Tax=Longitalea luteola TaxID=2812563 RepID=UPI001A96A733|nr:malectin domain-containing carbohydrate-binding protein [Longitalea luteola]
MFRKFTWRNAGITLLACFVCTAEAYAQNCNCAVTIPLTQQSFNASTVQPGDTVCLAAGVRTRNLLITNVNGTAANPIVFINCGGKVTFSLASGLSYGIKFQGSKHFRITGTGSSDLYGIVVDSAAQGMQLEALSTNFEVDHLEIKNSGFAGIMAKTDNSGRGTFVMRNVKFHHNYMHDQRTGEGFYIGHFNWAVDGDQHDIDTLELYDNITERTGREGIQIGCTYSGKAKIYNNRVIDPGLLNLANQRSGVQLGNGFSGSFYNNYIEDPVANGITVLGVGNVYVYNNVIVNPGEMAIYSGHPTSEAGKHFYYVNNTILMGSSTQPVIRFDPTVACTGYIQNNAIVRTATDTAFDRMSGTMVVSGNVIRTTAAPFNFENAAAGNYDLLTGSVAINAGVNPTGFSIPFDFENRPRPVAAYDAGAYEFQGTPGPTVLYRVNAGGLEVAATPIPWEKDKQTDPCAWLDPASPNYTTGSDQPWGGTNTTDAPSQIFSTNRYAAFGGTQVNYNFPVSNGTYEVRLYFAENSNQAAGLRVFDVQAEGTVRLDNFDIYAAAGYRNAHKETINVTVTDGTLDLDFVAVTGNPQINGIAIVPATAARQYVTQTTQPVVEKNRLLAYPVPLQNQLYIQKQENTTGTFSTEDVEVQLLNESGTLLYKARHQFTGGNMKPLNLSPLGLKPGLYFLRITGSKTNEVMKLLKR